MEHTVVVLHRGALAHYTVCMKDDGCLEAALLKYGGSSHDLPPPRIHFTRDGRHCTGDTDEQDLMDDLYHAVQSEVAQSSASGADSNPETYVSI